MSDEVRQLDAILLAAGKGKRMKSDLPKALHEVADRPMLQWVIEAARQAGAERCLIVVGHRSALVREALAHREDLLFIEQSPQLGTGHAAMVCEPAFRNADEGDVLVLAGDMPLFTGSTLAKLVEHHRRHGCAGTLATARLPDPTGYGRIVRDGQGRFQRIVEHHDADDAQRDIDEANISCYCFDRAALFDALKQIGADNTQGEYYLTDVLAVLLRQGRKADALCIVSAEEAQGVNDPEQLRRVDEILRRRLQAAQAPRPRPSTAGGRTGGRS